MHKKFEINQKKIKDGCQSGRKVVLRDSKSDLPLVDSQQCLPVQCVSVLLHSVLRFLGIKTIHQVALLHWLQLIRSQLNDLFMGLLTVRAPLLSALEL